MTDKVADLARKVEAQTKVVQALQKFETLVPSLRNQTKLQDTRLFALDQRLERFEKRFGKNSEKSRAK